MKRSEMIKKLTERIKIDMQGVIDICLFESEADAILNRLEQLGMRPPLAGGDLAGYVEDGEWELENIT
jgi:hypothetical protein